MTRIIKHMAAALIFLSVTACVTTPVLEQRYYKVKNIHSGRYLTVAKGGESRNGGLVYVWDWKDSSTQKWELTHLGGGYYKLTVRVSGKVLDANSDKVHQNGCNVQIWDLNGWDNQKWRLRPLDNGRYKIQVKSSNKCLALTPYDSENGAALHLWQRRKGDYLQDWEVIPLE
jgi:hypothetical protein